MQIRERAPGEAAVLRKLARRAKDADQKDRYMVVVHAIGGMETKNIQDALARSRGFVQRWAYAYRDGGIAALGDTRRGGSIAKINGQNLVRLKARLDAGPTEADGVCSLRGTDVRRIARDELGVDISLNGVYGTLHRMGYSCLAPRPRHEKQDLAAQKKFKEVIAPFLSAP